MNKLFASFCAVAALCSSQLRADQPVFNEMPRWDDGWGIQLLQEYRTESDLLKGRDIVASGFREEVHITHLQGVYTWDKSIRLTAKLPYVNDARRELPDGSGGKLTQRDKGFGDLTLALPLKHYINADRQSSSYTFAPQVKIPLGSKDDYDIYDREWGGGLSIGYERETFTSIVSMGLSSWFYTGDERFDASASLDIGYNFYVGKYSGHVKWENDLIYEDDNSLTYTAGPSLYLKITDAIHAKVSWKHDFYDRQGSLDHGRGNSIKIGIAYVY